MKGWRLTNVGYTGWTAVVDTNRAGMAEAGGRARGTYIPPDFGRIEVAAHPD